MASPQARSDQQAHRSWTFFPPHKCGHWFCFIPDQGWAKYSSQDGSNPPGNFVQLGLLLPLQRDLLSSSSCPCCSALGSRYGSAGGRGMEEAVAGVWSPRLMPSEAVGAWSPNHPGSIALGSLWHPCSSWDSCATR